MLRATVISPSARPPAVLRSRRGLSVHCNTLWSLSPDPKWCKENEKYCKQLGQVDLTGTIGSKRLCSVASHDFQSEEAIDMCILDHGGIHLVFQAEGASNPLDSPSILFVTDVDSTCTVQLDGKELHKGERVRVKPGARIAMGQEAVYEVQRNVFAHA